MHKLNIIDAFVIAAYIILCLFIAFRSIGKIKNIRDYTIGGNFSTRVLAATFFATFTGAGVILGYIERIHEVGLIFAAAMIFEPIAWIVTAKVFCNNIDYFKNKGCMSISDIMAVLYGDAGKWTSNISSLLLSIGTIALQIKAIGYLSEYFLGVPEIYGAMLGFAIVLTYSYFGGIRAVIFTDVLQSIVFLVGIPIACFAAYYSLGGYTALISHLPSSHKAIEMSSDNIMLLVGGMIYSLLPLSELAFVQRFLIARNAEQLRKALHHTFLLAIPFSMIVALTGFITVASISDTSSRLAFYELITNHLPVGIKGLVIAGLLAAIMSTADSFLNSASVLFAHNIMKPLFPRMEKSTELRLAKIASIAFSVLGLTLAFTGESLAKILWISENFWAPFTIVPLAAGFLKFYTNSTSFLGSLICAIAFIFLGRLVAGEFGIVSMIFGIAGNAFGLFFTHFMQARLMGRLSR